ncbi:MAG: hypothetical protein CVT92_15080 [Bacteroidetes bacterium HGW-Bacteroidetes-1]|jgi:peptidoglycan-associated lipoprotein|nr:MAG: hypothetical protein CVT92_15080 [Bacteroidetes bacterium HGW-Bacteroidetes-1]
MMKFFLTTLLISLFGFLSLNVQAQRNVAKSADEAFSRKQYSVAIDRYKKAYGRVKKNSDERDRIGYRLAESYRLTGNYKRAEITYRRVLRSEIPNRNPEILLVYADLLKMMQKYDEAIDYYNQYTKRVPDDPRGKLGAESAALIMEWLENPSKYEITPLKKVNSRDSDFAPAWSSNNFNEIIFTSNRDGATGKEKDGWTNKSFSDFFISRLDRNNQWSTPTLLDDTESINTKANEGAPFMNANFSTLYFTRCNNIPLQESGCQIFTSSRSGRSWSQPVPLQMRGVDSLDVVGHPTISDSELILYFATERKDGFGGKDIWVAMRDSKKDAFSRPLNLGERINTRGDEIFPFLRNDTTLYFASNGHGGMGGFDIFVSTIDTAGNWGEPKNLKHPVNSINDDFSIIFHPTEERGFFASNRENTRGVDNLYYFIEPPVLFTLAGTIKDDKTLQFIENATVNLVGSNGMSVSTRTNDKGYYLFGNSQLNKNTTYEIIVDKENYFTLSAVETTVDVEFSKDFVKDFLLMPIPEKPIPLPDILYDLASWELKPQYEDSLQGLIETLQQNPTIIIELASHTDSRDTDERNDILSQRRAQSVVDYLIIRGIDPDRLVAKGYGERVPRALERDLVTNGFNFKSGSILTEEFINNLKTENEKEAAHQLNRRTEFSVLSKDFVPKATNQPIDTIAVIKINPEENQIDFRIASDGSFAASLLVDGLSDEFVYDRTANASISLKKAMDFLQKGIINKENLVGDIEQIQAGTIANGAVFKLKEVRIANRTIKDLEVTVDHKMQNQIILGQRALVLFGEFKFNTNTKKLIFQ